MNEPLLLIEEVEQNGIQPVGAVLERRMASAGEDEQLGSGDGSVDAHGLVDRAKVAIACHDQDGTFDLGEVSDNETERGLCPHFLAFLRHDGPMRGTIGGDAIVFGKPFGEHGGRHLREFLRSAEFLSRNARTTHSVAAWKWGEFLD